MKLKKEFSDFHKEIRISSEADNLREKREILEDEIKTKLPGKLKDHGITVNKSDIRMFIQGSYKYNTTIVSDVVDMDVAVMIPLNIDENPDPRKIKRYLKESIDISKRSVDIKEPCVRASYYENGEEWMHIDLPLYADDDGDIYLARGKDTGIYKWEEADPDGLNENLCNKINGNDQLRRIICFVKKWRNEIYSNSKLDHEVPPSIGLTYLVCDNFVECTSDDGDDDLLALKKTMESIKNSFTNVYYDASGAVISADISKRLPVKPYTDIFSKMRESSKTYMVTFYKRLCVAVDNLTNAVNVESEHDAAKYVQKVLGEQFVVPEKKAMSASTNTKKEHNFG
ncbi:cyclic GMP-AMP synthase DncV-like nucleotidyltransferase [Pseudobutyrivibrio sp. MD2005]|uniref:cyclic GMP-AMP synthase DncV-like nucleotidyltransferase n=1 Tax=Pseudobutyrivibrio sp. MD2005 TaxID=1410616 RepID=UPI000488B202|nr:hypothetical protein [Pseudobutyrivibrio sp. MD2005]